MSLPRNNERNFYKIFLYSCRHIVTAAFYSFYAFYFRVPRERRYYRELTQTGAFEMMYNRHRVVSRNGSIYNSAHVSSYFLPPALSLPSAFHETLIFFPSAGRPAWFALVTRFCAARTQVFRIGKREKGLFA